MRDDGMPPNGYWGSNGGFVRCWECGRSTIPSPSRVNEDGRHLCADCYRNWADGCFEPFSGPREV